MFLYLSVFLSFLTIVSSDSKPKLLAFQAKDLSLVSNISYVLQCITTSGSKPLKFSWTHNNRQISSNLVHVENRDSSSFLSFDNLSSRDSGVYSCQVRNAFGSDTISTNLLIKGLGSLFVIIFCINERRYCSNISKILSKISLHA